MSRIRVAQRELWDWRSLAPIAPFTAEEVVCQSPAINAAAVGAASLDKKLRLLGFIVKRTSPNFLPYELRATSTVGPRGKQIFLQPLPGKDIVRRLDDGNLSLELHHDEDETPRPRLLRGPRKPPAPPPPEELLVRVGQPFIIEPGSPVRLCVLNRGERAMHFEAACEMEVL